MDLNKLKVPELRKELQARGLDSKGNKPVLVERLREAIDKEQENDDSENDEEVTSSEENSLMYTTADGENEPVAAAAAVASEPAAVEERPFSVITAASHAPQPVDEKPEVVGDESSDSIADEDDDQTVIAAQPPQPPVAEPVPSEPAVDYSRTSEPSQKEVAEESPQPSPVAQQPPQEQPVVEEQQEPQPVEATFEDSSSAEDSQPVPQSEPEKMDFEEANAVQSFATHADDAAYARKSYATEPLDGYGRPNANNVEETSQSYSSDVGASEDDSRGPAPEAADSNDVSRGPEYDENMDAEDAEPTKVNDDTNAQNDEAVAEQSNDYDAAWADLTNKEQPNWGDEVEAANNVQPPTTSDDLARDGEAAAEEPKKRVRRSRFDQPESGHEDKSNRSEQPEDRKRRHSPSPTSWSNNYEAPPKIAKQDDEPSFDEDAVLLSWYDSDLNLIINKENFTSAVPLHEHGFVYMWAGARSSYGFKSGKIYYDVKLLEKTSATVSDDFEIFSFRLGCSVEGSSLQLGEVPLSYGYDSAGKKCTENNFEDYGQAYNPEDVVGCLLDFESDEQNVQISFALNGTKLDVAFEIPKESLGEKALFPHVLSKNISFEVNFGERSEPWLADEAFKEGFEWASKVPVESRVRGPKKPEEKKDCEMVLVCGLPCSGKTTWVQKHVEENPDKHYCVIGVQPVLEKMKILGESILEHFQSKEGWLAERCTRCVNSLIDTASCRWRNYILDQVNVQSQTQRGKARAFEGFKRWAVVTLPSESDYEEYVKKLEENPIRDTPLSVLELKGYFRLPEEGDIFEKVEIVGVDKEEAKELVRKYQKEGRDARPRDDRSYGRYGGGRDMDRGQYGGRPPFRSRWGGSDRGPPPPMGRGGGWGGPRGGMDRMPPGGGFRDRRGWRDRSPDNDRDGGFRNRYQPHGGGRYGGGGRGMMDSSRSWGSGGRDRDRMGPPPRMGGGPNPLMGSMMGGKPGGPMGYGERKSRFDEPKRRGGEHDGDEFERRPPMGGEDGSGGEDGDRKRRSRFSDSRGFGGGFRGGRGGNDRGSGGFGGRGGRPGQFPPRGPPEGGAGFGRNREDGYFGGNRGGGNGGPPRRDARDSKPPMGQRPAMNRFGDKNDAAGKNDANPAMNSQAAWGMYGQAGWNPAAASQYQNWAQYQQSTGYTPQQLQQYWSQMQQHQQQQQQQQQASTQSKAGQPGGKAGAQTGASGTSATSQAAGSQPQSGAAAGYSTQGAAGYGTQGYDANAYAQYCAQYTQYYSQLAAQGWTQNADGSYSYPQNAWGQYGYNAGNTGSNGVPSTTVPASTNNTSSISSNQKSGPVTTNSSK